MYDILVVQMCQICPKITDIVPQKGQNDSNIVIIDLAIIYDVIFHSV